MAGSSQDVGAARAFYNRMSTVYDRLAEADERAAREAGLRLLDARRGEQVLEIGFGTGQSLALLAEAVQPDGRVYGVDISNGMCRVAEERLRAAGVEDTCVLTVAAVPPLPYPPAQFDAAFLTFTLELFPADTIPLVLAEIRRTLRPTGRLGLASMSTPAADERETLAERAYKWMHRQFPHLIDCRPIDLRAFLADNGFVVEQEQRLAIWTMPVSVCLARPAASNPPPFPA